LGLAGTLGGGFLGAWMQRQSQDRQEHRRQKDRDAEVVGTAYQLNIDAAPARLGLNRSPAELMAQMLELMLPHDASRTQLWMLAARHESEEVRELATQASEMLVASFVAGIGFVQAHHKNPDNSREAGKLAEVAFEASQQALTKLMKAIQDH
jgi:hypothetical protein